VRGDGGLRCGEHRYGQRSPADAMLLGSGGGRRKRPVLTRGSTMAESCVCDVRTQEASSAAWQGGWTCGPRGWGHRVDWGGN
jgi:hypothetical protein